MVMLGATAFLRGVVVVVGPLHGLGSDQANKSKRLGRGIEAWHINDFGEPEPYKDMSSHVDERIVGTHGRNQDLLDRKRR